MRTSLCRLGDYLPKSLILVLIVNLLFGLAFAEKALAASLDNWPVPRHDYGHSGYNSNVGSFKPPLVFLDTIKLLDTPIGPAPILNLITDQDRIYAMGQHIIWGVNKLDTSMQWRNDECLPVEGEIDFCFISYMASFPQRLVIIRQKFFYSTSDFGYELAILDAKTGEIIRRRPLGNSAPEIGLELAPEGYSTILLTEEASVGKLTKRTIGGSKIFKTNAEISGFPGSRAVVAAGRFIYVNGDTVHAYRTDDGLPAWTYTPTSHDDPHGYDLVATADAVIVSQDERVIKLDIVNGTLLWEQDIKPDVCNGATSPNAATTDGTTILVTAVCDEEVVALNYDNGAVKWRKNIGLQIATSHAFGGDTLYAASTTAPLFNIYAFDPDSNVELEKMELHIDDYEPSAVLTISDGLLQIAGGLGDKKIHRFERMPADLSAEITSISSQDCGAIVGDTMVYEFLVTNHGPGTTDNPRVTLKLPVGDTTLSTDAGSCSMAATTFCDLGPLSVGQQVQITATIKLSTADTYAGPNSPGIKLTPLIGGVRDKVATNDSDTSTLSVDSAPPVDLDLQLTDIEITQGIQNLANEVLLNTGKATFVRVYGQTNGPTIRTAKAVLHGEDLDSGEDLGTLKPIKATECVTLDGDPPDRSSLSESFVFELPPSWLGGGRKFTAEINPGGIIPETDTANNTLLINRSFSKLPRICLITYRVRSIGTPLGDSGIIFNLYPGRFALAGDTGNMLSRALTMLPAREIKVYPQSHKLQQREFLSSELTPYEFSSEDNDDSPWVQTKLYIRNTLTDDPDDCDADGSRSHYIGMIDEGTIYGVAMGLGKRPGDEVTMLLKTSGNGFDDPVGGRTLAHELGHNYGRRHIKCGDPEPENAGSYPDDRDVCDIAPDDPRGYYGFEFLDTTKPTVISPTGAGDLMSYESNRWPSEFTWEAIQDKLCSANDCFRPSLLVQSQAEIPATITGDVLVVAGQISPMPGLQVTLRLPAADVPKVDKIYADQVAARPLIPVYTLDLLDGLSVLHSEPFTPDDMAGQLTLVSAFGLVIPWNPSTTHIELKENGVIIDSMDVSPSPPVVTSISPNGGETMEGEELTISWTATDPDGDDLRYTVLYSNDNGSTWHALVSDMWAPETLTVDSSLLPGCDTQCLVKVIASDGLNTGSRQSAAGFTMPDRTPNSFIYFPDDGDTYSSGSSLTLRGGVYDPEDHYLPDDEMNWNLSGVGLIGTGDGVVLPDLADGDYTLTLSASDSSGQEGSLSITFTIGPEPDFESDPVPGATVAFGDQVVQTESLPMLVKVENSGDADLTLVCSLSGENPGSFLLKACPNSITGTGSDDISVSCHPGSLGAQTATLDITTNDPDEPAPSYNLTCTGIEAPLEETVFADGFEG